MEIETRKLDGCVCCGGKQFEHLLDANDFQAHTGTYSIEICKNCQLGLTSPRPTEESLPKLYESQDSGVDISTRSKVGFFLKSMKLKFYVEKLLKNRSHSKMVIFDVGCGDGLLPWIMAQSSKCEEVIALDFPERTPELFLSKPLKNLRYFSFHSMRNASLPKADMITLRHVLEHVLDPIGYLKELSRFLKPGGRFLIEVPDRDSIWVKVFEKDYNQLAVPFHLSHFTEKSFRNIFEKDFNIRSFRKVNVPVLGPSLGLKLGLRTSNIGLIAVLFYPLQILMDRLSGTSTALMIEMENPTGTGTGEGAGRGKS